MTKSERDERIQGLLEQLSAVEAKRVKGWKTWARNLRSQIRAVMRAGT